MTDRAPTTNRTVRPRGFTSPAVHEIPYLTGLDVEIAYDRLVAEIATKPDRRPSFMRAGAAILDVVHAQLEVSSPLHTAQQGLSAFGRRILGDELPGDRTQPENERPVQGPRPRTGLALGHIAAAFHLPRPLHH